MDIQKKILHISSDRLNVKQLPDESLSIAGYANTTTIDRTGDVITEDAWNKGGLNNYLKNPVVLAYHNHEDPIGLVTDYSIDARGLHVVAEISKAAGKIYTLIKKGIIRAFSVGFRVKDADYDSNTDTFIIKDLELFEISVVAVPANADSLFSVRKSFQSEEEYVQFKNIYSKKVETPNKNLGNQLNTKEKESVDKDKISLTPEELEAAKQKAIEDAIANMEAEKARQKAIEDLAITAGTTGAEKLLKDIEKKFEDRYASESETLKEKLAAFEADLKEKSTELESMRKNKMSFGNPNGKSKVTNEEVDAAVLISKVVNKDIENTKYGKDLITKAAGDSDHLASTTYKVQWESEFSTRLYQDIKDRTIMEPLFTNRIQMTTRTMSFPWNPEAGYASWIDDSNYKSGTADEFYDGAESTGTARTHLIKDNVILAEKLATKEFIGYEEEEDTILPIVPIIRDAVMRRMVRSTDTELLRGNIGSDTGSGTGLIDGCGQLAVDNGATYTPAGAFGDAITIADLQSTRRQLDRWGVAPGEVVYVVSQSVYYDLLEDPDFRTMDLVGPNATILRGQIGMVNGSPVIVSDSFITNAASTMQAIALNVRNYLFGELRGLTVENGRDILNQKNAIVASRRFGFKEIIPASVSGRSACAALVVQA